MTNRRSIQIVFVVSMVAALSAGCRRDQPAQVAESQTQSPVLATNSPATLAGCLRAGEAADTFVLTTTGQQAATYHLVPDEGVDLREHIGRQIQVDGIIREQQRTTSTAAATPADGQAVGTAGAATVATRTQVDMKRFEVSTLKSVGGDCK